MKKYDCCGGDPECSINKTEKFADDLFTLYEEDKAKAKDMLLNYMIDVESERDWFKYKLKKETL